MAKQPQTKKKLILCLDGTLQDGDIMRNRDKGTNIWKLARAVKRHDQNNCHQIVSYQSGVGTNDWTASNLPVTSFVKSVFEGGTGAGLGTKVRDAYLFLARNWEPGDEVYIFGFSRGAYTARTTAALIGDIGYLGKGDMESFWEIYAHYQLASARPGTVDRTKADKYLEKWRERKRDWERQNVTEKFSIRVLGVFDTVGAFGIPGFVPKEINFFGFSDLYLGPHIEHAYHAMALNENRATFPLTKWKFDASHQPAPGQTVKQVWFGGSHTDIGGGWPASDLGVVSLVWMASNVKDMLSLDLNFIVRDSEFRPYRPWGNLRPHDPGMNHVIRSPRSNSITLSAPHNGAAELIHPSAFEQDFKEASKLWPEQIRTILRDARANSGVVATLAPIEEELRDKTFKDNIRANGASPLPAHGLLTNVKGTIAGLLGR